MEYHEKSNAQASNNSGIIYKIDDRPPLLTSIVLGIQHILAAFGGIVAVPLVVGGALDLPTSDVAFLVSAAIFVAGIATFIQAKGIGPIGAKVPCVMGTDFTFVAPSIAVGSTMGLPGLFGGTILGSFIEMVISRFIKPLMRFFPPVVTGTVVTLIGLTLLPVSIDWAAGGTGASDYGRLQNIVVAVIVLIIIILLNRYAKGMFSTASVLIGIVIGYIIAYPLGMIDFTEVANANWIELPTIFKYGVTFNLKAVIPFIAAYLVTSIETVGCLIAIGEASDRRIDSKGIGAGLLADGVGSFIAGFFGAGANTSFSQNVGLIPMTKVASRFVVIIAGIILMILGIFPKLGALVAIMPEPVLGGAGIVMFGMVAASGIKTLSRVKMTNRNLLIIAVSIGLGLGVTVRPEIISNLPESLKMLFSSGISTGTIAALILNLVLKEEKGSTIENISIKNKMNMIEN
ncbi:purine permease [Schnuerera sp. xch1]|uniref:uracil-xanthine permease family protein n=1 Tax=Schnuerera sp. xch1 TaxID=2874283 RepID=UPI001CBD47D4|nr:nucleobase:cation symporter-2 family protein [Schnuerera sp. xch1]MBZ2175010.1 purine permease [Schnuerera sp. xch1]